MSALAKMKPPDRAVSDRPRIITPPVTITDRFIPVPYSYASLPAELAQAPIPQRDITDRMSPVPYVAATLPSTLEDMAPTPPNIQLPQRFSIPPPDPSIPQMAYMEPPPNIQMASHLMMPPLSQSKVMGPPPVPEKSGASIEIPIKTSSVRAPINIQPLAPSKVEVETTPEPPKKTGLSVVIDVTTHKLKLFSSGRQIKEYPVAVGKPSTPTPIGEFAVTDKHINNPNKWGRDDPSWAPEDAAEFGAGKNPMGTRWLGFHTEPGVAHYGIHGTPVPQTVGTDASHGCVRMLNKDVEELFRWIDLKTPVKVMRSTNPVSPNVLKNARQNMRASTLADVLRGGI